MPVVFEPTDVLHLNRYGKFTTWRYPGFIISASNAITISADDTNKWTEPLGKTPHATDYLELRPHMGIEKWGCVVERFNWGYTSVPDLVYYEIWNYGRVVPSLTEGFHCCGKIGLANQDNRSTHPVAGEKLELKVWNCSGDAPRDVWVEFSAWLYWFPLDNLPVLFEISDISLMQEMNQKHQAVVNELIKLRSAIEAKPEFLAALGR